MSGSVLHKYVPEFESEFSEKSANAGVDRERNYVIKAYVFGSYLYANVSLERGGFEFTMDRDLFFGIAQIDIETEAASIAKNAIGDAIRLRQEKKREHVRSYVDEEAPWHKDILGEVDLSALPYSATKEQIETYLHTAKFARERTIKGDIDKLLSEGNLGDVSLHYS